MGLIQFFCPKCSKVIEVNSELAGNRMECDYCHQQFVVPKKSYTTPKKIEAEIPRGDPIPGFYKAVFVQSFGLFGKNGDLLTWIIIISAVVFKFISGLGMCCINYGMSLVSWGVLFGIYLSLIYDTAYDVDKMPQVSLGDSTSFMWNIIKPVLVMIFTLLFVLLPFIIALSIYSKKGQVDLEQVSSIRDLPIVLNVLSFIGVLVFPSAILITTAGRDIVMLLRLDYLLRPIAKATIPYVTTIVFVVLAIVIQSVTQPYDPDGSTKTNAIMLFLNLAVQIPALFAARAIGLFFRHYGCYFKW